MERAEREEPVGGRRGSYEGASDLRLIEGMRAMDSWAYHEFFERLVPLLLAHAQRCGVRREDRWMTVVELLDDLALRLTRLRQPVPRSLEALATVSLRRRLITARRNESRRRALESEQASALSGGERVIASAASAASLDASDPFQPDPAGEPQHGAEAIVALGRALRLTLSEDDARLLEWMAERVPQRDAAEWLGTTHGALRVRISRLKTRLRLAARRHEARLDGAEREAVRRFLDRVEGRNTPREDARLDEGREDTGRTGRPPSDGGASRERTRP
jgi:hypothetical protein